jgi:hypothetical protein
VVAEGVPTGRIIAVQIKSGPSFFKYEDADRIVFRGKPEHLTYWLNYSLPVLLVLYHSETKTAYWQQVRKETIAKTGKGWKMSIPRQQRLEKAQMSNLDRIAWGPQRIRDEVSEFRCPFCGAPLAERGGDWVGSEHFGLHEIFECGYHALDGCLERPCPHDPKFPPFEAYKLEFHPPAAGKRGHWLCIALPKTEMAGKLRIGAGCGCTRKEAEKAVLKKYESYAVARKP